MRVGFEPLTFSLRTRRATNCATAPERRSNRRETKRYHPRGRHPNPVRSRRRAAGRPRRRPRVCGLLGLGGLGDDLGVLGGASRGPGARLAEVDRADRALGLRLGDVRRQGDRQRVPQRAAVLGRDDDRLEERRPAMPTVSSVSSNSATPSASTAAVGAGGRRRAVDWPRRGRSARRRRSPRRRPGGSPSRSKSCERLAADLGAAEHQVDQRQAAGDATDHHGRDADAASAAVTAVQQQQDVRMRRRRRAAARAAVRRAWRRARGTAAAGPSRRRHRGVGGAARRRREHAGVAGRAGRGDDQAGVATVDRLAAGEHAHRGREPVDRPGAGRPRRGA